jgi:hypothetical protein
VAYSPIAKEAAITSPLPHCDVAEKYMDRLEALTPAARPVSWVVEQVNTQVKMLRLRAEKIARPTGATPCPSAALFSSAYKRSSAAEGGNYERVAHMQFRLAEALTVIEEQDRLIHEGDAIHRMQYTSRVLLSLSYEQRCWGG